MQTGNVVKVIQAPGTPSSESSNYQVSMTDAGYCELAARLGCSVQGSLLM